MAEQAFSEIPVDNAEDALRFCQSLAQALNGKRIGGDALSLPRQRGDRLAKPRPELSVVVPVYNEEDNLAHLHDRLTAVLEGEGMSHEIVFVDDGSQDSSLELMYSIAARDGGIVIVELARNFGQQVAISAGLDYAQGNAVITMDADLQDPPEVLPQFIAKWQEGYDVVYAIREHRKEGWPRRAAYAAFYRLLRRIANVEIPLDAGDFCLMDRKVVDLLQSMPERNRFVRGIRSWVGLRQLGIPYERQAREAGQPKYTFGRLMLLALDGFISFSHAPLRVASILGFAISLVSLLMAALYFVKRVTTGLNPPGFATLVVAVFFLAGVQLVTLGVIGEYVGRIFDEVKQRPLYIVRRVTGGRR
jgi:glycosyltransferase involved in cell wall biosynthesis